MSTTESNSPQNLRETLRERGRAFANDKIRKMQGKAQPHGEKAHSRKKCNENKAKPEKRQLKTSPFQS